MSLLYAIIFITGAAILALELLASRILTPYFGVSIFIWTGILSITLVALAAGYWAGGRLTQTHRRPSTAKLASWYLAQPAWAALAIVGACLVYPVAFHALAGFDLVAGAFIACSLLLFLPLLTTSAMNPLLVALMTRSRGDDSAPLAELDAGSGRVFFVSTVGSVAGVVVTAFLLMPFLSNYDSVLVVALVLALLSLAGALRPPMPVSRRTGLLVLSLVASLASAGLLVGSGAYLDRLWPARYSGAQWEKRAEYGSLFGTVKVLSGPVDAPESDRVLIYFQDGLVQNTLDGHGRSQSFFTYGLEALSQAYRPDARQALVLGLGAGVVPMSLSRRGIEVTAVEIDPASFAVAQRHFGFDPSRVNAIQADARTWLRGCRAGQDVVIVDLFHGDGVPEYLVTRDFFRDVARCLRDDGIAVFNTFADLDRPGVYADFLATLNMEFPHAVIYRPDPAGSRHVNSFVVASTRPLRVPAFTSTLEVPGRHAGTLREMLAQPLRADALRSGRGQVVTDARNSGTLDIAAAQLAYRRLVIETVPPGFLVN